jgi:hypothetical protein
MSNQNAVSDVLVELSAEEQELLSGGHYHWAYHRHRRRRGEQRQKNTQIVNIILPRKRRGEDDYVGGDYGGVDYGGGEYGGSEYGTVDYK